MGRVYWVLWTLACVLAVLAALILKGHARSPELDAARLLHARELGAALIHAVKGNDLAAAARAIDQGADINARDARGMTALMHAANRDPAMVLLLLRNGAEVNARDNMSRSALFLVHHTNSPQYRLLQQAGGVE